MGFGLTVRGFWLKDLCAVQQIYVFLAVKLRVVVWKLPENCANWVEQWIWLRQWAGAGAGGWQQGPLKCSNRNGCTVFDWPMQCIYSWCNNMPLQRSTAVNSRLESNACALQRKQMLTKCRQVYPVTRTALPVASVKFVQKQHKILVFPSQPMARERKPSRAHEVDSGRGSGSGSSSSDSNISRNQKQFQFVLQTRFERYMLHVARILSVSESKYKNQNKLVSNSEINNMNYLKWCAKA